MPHTVASAGDLAVRWTVGTVRSRELASLARAAEERDEVAVAVPAAESILIVFRAPTALEDARRFVASLEGTAPGELAASAHRIEVAFSEHLAHAVGGRVRHPRRRVHHHQPG